VKHYIFEAEQFILSLLRFVFYALGGGNTCIACGKKTFLIPVCKTCDKKFFSVQNIQTENRCALCGKELISAQNKCLKCRQEPVLVHTDCVYPLFSYRLWNKSLLFEWKIRGERCLSAFFAKKMALFLNKNSYGVLIPVPPRKGKIKQKGWDQINEICQFLRWRYGFKILNVLERLTLSEQKKMNRAERLEHINNAYKLVGQKKLKRVLKPFYGKIPKEVCLIDDVCTTGSTIESCSAVLKAAGVKKVSAVTLFTVD
jgi:ComF family protein